MSSPAQSQQKILFFSTLLTPFIEIDRQILSEHAQVHHVTSSGILTAIRIFYSTLFVDVVFSWFASTYSAILVFTARLFKKKSIVIVGGADVNMDPQIGYGLLRSRWKRPFVRYAIRHATSVLPMSQHLNDRTRRVGDYDGANIHDVPPGVDSEFWQPGTKKEPMVLAVAACATPERIRIKGIDSLLEAARSLKGVPIVIIGVEPNILGAMKIPIPPSVTILPPVAESDLLIHYQRAKVYCQPSRVESFSFTLAQAMLCECVPVASNIGGMPEVVGKEGFLVPSESPEALSKALRWALDASEQVGQAAREHIRSKFSLRERSHRLRELITG